MNTKKNVALVLLFFVSSFTYSQITVGSYTGITQLSNITSTCNPIVNTVLGDVNFATNSGVEIALGTSFTGTWANGQAYSDGPGSEILCVSVHTEEWWDVQLYLSDFSFTPAVNAAMLNVEDNITLDFWNCAGIGYYNFTYDRRVVELDFSMFAIPPGLQVIGARFTLTGDNAVNPDPIGLLYIGSGAINNNGPLCTGDTLILNVDTVAGATYSWTGPASFTSNLQNPILLNVTLANAGIYTCIITDTINASSDTLTTTVVIVPFPVASLVVTNPYCLGDPINLDASGTTPLASISTFYYDLDNNGSYETSTLNPIYNATSSFSTAGNFPISLITQSTGGCTDTVSAIVNLYNKPIVGLTVTDPTVCIYNDADFQALAFIFNAAGQSSFVSNYEWDFDFNGTTDASGAALTNVTHHFPGLGTYPVVVTVTSSVGCERLDTVNVTIVDIPHGNIVAPQVCGNQAASFTFNNTGLPLSTYNWNFGDLTVTTDISSNSSPTYLYPGNGVYGITLIVGTADGCLDTMNTLINVDPLPAGSIPNTAVCVGADEVFTFTQTSTDSIVNYNWNFLNGTPSSSNLASPTIVFNFGGPTIVSVIITNQYGCSDTIIQPFMVNKPTANFEIYPICISRFTFDPTVTPDDQTVVIDWDLGDGTLLTSQDTSYFNHIYTEPGDYNVTLIVTDQYGCEDTITKPVHVDDSLFVLMPNVLVQSSTMENNQVDMNVIQPSFNLCIDYTYTVFDRWGIKVFQIHNDPHNPDLSCDDCFKGVTTNGAPLTPGVYFYVMQGNFNIIKSGSITIFE